MGQKIPTNIQRLFSQNVQLLDEDWEKIHAHLRIFYWIKSFILFCLVKPVKLDYGKEVIIVLAYGHYTSYFDGDRNWTEVTIGRGIFKGWHWSQYANGT